MTSKQVWICLVNCGDGPWPSYDPHRQWRTINGKRRLTIRQGAGAHRAQTGHDVGRKLAPTSI